MSPFHSMAEGCLQMVATHTSVTADREGRSRPFPPQTVLGPTFTSGSAFTVTEETP
jgi:hypothetical protein